MNDVHKAFIFVILSLIDLLAQYGEYMLFLVQRGHFKNHDNRNGNTLS